MFQLTIMVCGERDTIMSFIVLRWNRHSERDKNSKTEVDGTPL